MPDEKSEKIITHHFLVFEWKWKKFKEKLGNKHPDEFFREAIEKIINKEA